MGFDDDLVNVTCWMLAIGLVGLPAAAAFYYRVAWAGWVAGAALAAQVVVVIVTAIFYDDVFDLPAGLCCVFVPVVLSGVGLVAGFLRPRRVPSLDEIPPTDQGGGDPP